MIRTAIAAAFLAATFATGAMAADVGGKYDVRGTNPDGSKYKGTARIEITSSTTCRITWNVGADSSGICMRNGVALAAGYVLGDKVGLVIYEIRDDGTLDGIWTVADEDGSGTELLIPQ
ncbi:MAG TPA: hypothetical protein VHA70_05735 [Bauldia sp.]|nr:hypothetical protein [Bauldia sp.]